MNREKLVTVRVGGVLIEDNKILLIKHKKKEKEYWLFPGGGVEFGETFEETIIREYKEECNIKVFPKNILFISTSIDPSGRRHIVNVIFRVKYISGTLKIGKEKVLEDLSFIPVNEIKNIDLYPPLKNEIMDVINNKSNNIKYIKNKWE